MCAQEMLLRRGKAEQSPPPSPTGDRKKSQLKPVDSPSVLSRYLSGMSCFWVGKPMAHQEFSLFVVPTCEPFVHELTPDLRPVSTGCMQSSVPISAGRIWKITMAWQTSTAPGTLSGTPAALWRKLGKELLRHHSANPALSKPKASLVHWSRHCGTHSHKPAAWASPSPRLSASEGIAEIKW